MIHARRTDAVSRVVPTSDLVVHHTKRCFFDNDVRIFEYLQPMTVTYPACIMVSFSIILVTFDENKPDDIVPVYVDSNGWMIHEEVLTKLLNDRKVARVI